MTLDWAWTHHALSRAVDMAVDPGDLRLTLLAPARVYPTRDGRSVYQRGRIALVVDVPDARVVTCIWNNAGNKTRWRRDDLALCRDLP